MKMSYLNDRLAKIVTIFLFAILSIWWIILFFYFKASLENANLIWAACYQAVSIWGGMWGLLIAHKWGGLKSIVGRAIFFFALGLLFQTFGQTVFSIYGLFLQVPIPYPSLADIGFFGSIPCYVYAVFELGKASGVIISIKSFGKKLLALLIPLLGLSISYSIFLRSYEFDWSFPLRIFLDFGYPLGQVTYVSFVALVYVFSRNFLGGVMKNRVLFILIALIAQYVADYNFLYQFSVNSWVNGGYGDYIYLVSYFFMALGLIGLATTLRNLKDSN